MPREGYDYDPAYVNQANKLEVLVKKSDEDDNAYNLITGLQSASFTPTDKTTTPINNIVGRSSTFSGPPQKPTGSLTFGEITVSMAHITLQRAHDNTDEVTIQRVTYGSRKTPSAGISLTASVTWQIPANGWVSAPTGLIAALRALSVDWDGAIIRIEPSAGNDQFYTVDRAESDASNNLTRLKIQSAPANLTLTGSAGESFEFPYSRDSATVAAYPSTAVGVGGKLHVYQGLDQFLFSDFEVLTELLPSDDAVGVGEAYVPSSTINLQGTSTIRRQYALPTS